MATEPPTTSVETEPVPTIYDFTAISPIVQNFINKKQLNGKNVE